MTEQPRGERKPGLVVGAALLFALAAFGTFYAWVVFALACDEGCAPSERTNATVQLFVALAGLIAAGLMTYWTATGSRRLASRALIISILLYVFWAGMLEQT